MDEKIIIGYRKFTSKAGKSCCIVNVLSEYSQFDMEHGAYGQTAEEVFIPAEYHSLINKDAVGKPCVFTYGRGFNGNAVVNGIEIL